MFLVSGRAKWHQTYMAVVETIKEAGRERQQTCGAGVVVRYRRGE